MSDPYDETETQDDRPGYVVPPPPGAQQAQAAPGQVQALPGQVMPRRPSGWLLFALCAAGGVAAGVMLKGEIDRWQRKK